MAKLKSQATKRPVAPAGITAALRTGGKQFRIAKKAFAGRLTGEELKNILVDIPEGRAPGKATRILRAFKLAKIPKPQLLLRLGIDARYLKARNITVKDLRKLDYSSSDLRQLGFSLRDLYYGEFPKVDLLSAGFSPTELSGMFFPYELATSGHYAASKIYKARLVQRRANHAQKQSKAEMEARRYSFHHPIRVKGQANISPKENILSVRELRKSRLESRGSTTKRAPSTSAVVLLKTGPFADKLHKVGFSKFDLEHITFPIVGLWKAANLYNSPGMYHALREHGALTPELSNALRFYSELRHNNLSIEKLRNADFSAAELLQLGFSPHNLLTAGYSQPEVNAAYALLRKKR